MDNKTYETVKEAYTKLNPFYQLLGILIIPLYGLMLTLYEFIKGATAQLVLLLINLFRVCFFTVYMMLALVMILMFFNDKDKRD
jgi:hypothetical protein